MFRKIIFWSHLAIGVAFGLVIAMLSVTGVLLTYERQLIEWADARAWTAPAAPATPLSIADLAAHAEAAGVAAKRVTVFRTELAPARVGGGRRDPSTYVDIYTGDALGQPENSVRSAMATLTNVHRWFAASGDSRDAAKLVVGIANLGFLLLLLSGAYLWLPRLYRWSQFKKRLLLQRRYPNAKNRDYFWHHVFAAWALIPLVAIVLTGLAISFHWSHDLLLAIAGDDPGRAAQPVAEGTLSGRQPMSLDQLLLAAKTAEPNWSSIAVVMPAQGAATVDFEVDSGSGRQPHKRHTLTLDAGSGDVVRRSGFADRPAARKAIATNRFVHTGEWFGSLGQTIAGLASLASLLLVWTGLAQAWRRLILPLYRKRVSTLPDRSSRPAKP